MSSHAELFGRIIHHLTPCGQKPAKAQVYCPREELVDITETDPQKGSTHTILWWNPEERPQEGTFVRVSGEWKSFRDDVELHVRETECTHQGMFEDVFSYSSQIQSIIKREGVIIESGALCGFFSHPEPIVSLDIPNDYTVDPKEKWSLGWPLIHGQPIFSVPIRLKKEDEWLANQHGKMRVHEEALVLLGVPEKKAQQLSLRFRTLGETSLEQIAEVRRLVGTVLQASSLNPECIDGSQEEEVHNLGLLFSRPFGNTDRLSPFKNQTDKALMKSFLGAYFGKRDPKSKNPVRAFPIIALLNWEQFLSVAMALSSELTVVTGPPGTGKSQVLLAATAASILRGEKVLIATNNNQALDLLFEKMKRQIPIALPIRLGRKDLWPEMAALIAQWRECSDERNKEPMEISYQSTQRAIEELYSISSLKERKEKLRSLLPVCISWGEYLWERHWRKLEIHSSLEKVLEKKSNLKGVISSAGPALYGTTLQSAHNVPLEQGMFDLLIVDEASQCDVFSVVPALWRAKRVLVIGDDKQLAPVYGIDPDLDEQLGEKIPSSLRYTRSSFFSRCAQIMKPILLKEHHRSRPGIISLSNHLFYGDKLKAVRKKKNGAVQWFDISSDRGQQQAEAQWIQSFVEKYQERWEQKKYSVGIVAPFRSQVERLQKILPSVRIDTAHRFQGEECDIIILSLCVEERLSPRQWKFIEAPELVNVAITRAKERLVIVGDKNRCIQRAGLLASLASLVGHSHNSNYK